MSDSQVLMQIRADISDITAKMTDLKGHIGKVTDETQKLNEKSKGFLSQLKNDWVAVSVGIYAAFNVIKKGWDLAEKAAKFEEMEAGLQGLASKYEMTADAAIEMAKAAVDGQLSMMEAGKLAAKAFALGLNPDQVKTFLVQAERLTDVMGGEIPAAFDAMEKAAATGRSKGLVQYGINVDLKKSLEDYARSHDIAADSISASTAMQIRATAVMESAKKVTDQLGEATQSTADKMKKFQATIADIELTIGQLSIRGGAALIGMLDGVYAAAWTVVTALFKVGEAVAWVMSKVTTGGLSEAWKQNLSEMKILGDAAWEMATEQAEKGNAALQAAFAPKALLSKATAKPQDEADSTRTSSTTISAREAWAKAATDIRAAIEKEGLDPLEQSLVDIDTKISELLEKAAKLPTVTERKEAKGLIERFRESETSKATTGAALKDFEDALKLDKAWEDISKKRQAAKEAEINAQLTSLDIAEKEGTYHRDTLNERIRLLRQLLTMQEGRLQETDPKDTAAWNQQIVLIDQTKMKIVGFSMELRPAFAALNDYAEKAGDVWGNVGEAVGKTFKAMEDALVEFCMTGKFNFTDFANSVIRDLIRIAIRKALSGVAEVALGVVAKVAAVALLHEGGVPGVDAPSGFRLVPAGAFATAPRYHSGIGPDEQAAILRKDEGVFTQGQMKALGARMGGGSQQVIENHYHYETQVGMTINALDSSSVTKTLAQHQSQIVGIVNQAYNKMVKRGPMGS